MEIIEVPIEKIKFDKNQPRQTIDHDKVKELAQTIVTEGIVNPVEVDKTFTIITGELRTRAAKLAGLKTVPCKVMSINPQTRFRRQVIENLTNATMSDWDTAKALAKLLNLRPGRRFEGGKGHEGGISKLSREIGKSRDYISDHIEMLEVSQPLQKILKADEIPYTMIRAINRTPEPYQKAMEKKILAGDFKTRDSALEFAVALTRNPEKAQEILKATPAELHKISPRYIDKVEKALEPSQEFRRIKTDLFNWLDKYPPQAVLGTRKLTVLMGVTVLITKLAAWAKQAEQKQLN